MNKLFVAIIASTFLLVSSPLSARYYEASTARFLQEDPILLPMPVFTDSQNTSDSQSLNLYTYVDSVGKTAVNLYAYTENNPINRIDPLGLWYIDIGVSYGWLGAGGIGGVMVGPGGIYQYAGGGSTFGPGASFTWSPNDVAPGWNVGLQAGGWIGWQGGYSLWTGEKWAEPFNEYGIVTPGYSLAKYYVEQIWQWPWKKAKPMECPNRRRK